MNIQKTKYVEVIVPVPVDRLYTYSVPQEFQEKISVGSRVIVQFGNKKFYTGIVYSLMLTIPKNISPKPIQMLLDDEAIVSQMQLEFWQWIANYYLCSIGDVMKTALPAGLRVESETKIEIHPNYKEIDESEIHSYEAIVTQSLIEKQILSTNDIQRITGIKSVQNIINNLISKKIAVCYEEYAEKYIPKKVTYIQLSDELISDKNKLNELINSLEKRARKQANALLVFIQKLIEQNNSIIGEISKTELTKDTQYSAVQALIKKGHIIEEEKIISRFEINKNNDGTVKQCVLSEFQQIAYNTIKNSFQNQNVVLLHGVTSSGKTEIYIQLINDALNAKKQVLYLLPEIALTTQIIQRLKMYFGEQVGVFHHKFNYHERIELWQSVASDDIDKNRYNIIIGTRSALFLPFSNLGLIIVDEEHDYSFKQTDVAPRYNARDAAVYLGHLCNAKVILGTATPSIETYYNAEQGRYGLAELTKRYLDLPLPEVHLINMSQEFKKKHGVYYISNVLKRAIQDSLDGGNQIILFQNRRGFAPIVQCNDCAWSPVCKLCDITLTYHKQIDNLKCHLCGFVNTVPERCPDCGSTHIKFGGLGTEKIEEEIQAMFPTARVARMDTDSTRGKFSHQRIIESFENKEIDILVGTQMVSKGLDFDNVNLIGILDADSLMHFPEFRAFERAFQTITQIMGRAGRRENNGRVFLQTRNPKHPIIAMAVNGLFHDFYRVQKEERLLFKYPPFYRLILLSVKHKNLGKTIAGAEELKKHLQQIKNIIILGPETPIYSRIRLYYIRNILIKVPRNQQHNATRTEIKSIISQFLSIKEYSSLRIVADADPA